MGSLPVDRLSALDRTDLLAGVNSEMSDGRVEVMDREVGVGGAIVVKAEDKRYSSVREPPKRKE